MDAIRVPKVEGVLLTRAGQTTTGTLHLTTHHIIFRYDDADMQEMWIPYPLIALVTRQPQTLRGLSPLSVRTRTFDLFTLSFERDKDALDVFDSAKELTVAPSVYQLYAFFYEPNPPLAVSNGWNVYSPREEFGRMGVGTRSKAWRFTDINKDYSFSPTYPARIVVPTRISDTTLQYAAKYRSKARIPALTYLHWANFGTITRSSQPMVGLTANRSAQDEKLIETVFQSHHAPESRVGGGPVYGSTATNLIIDARPTTNAVANTAKGAGTENMDHYRDAKKAYLGIDNIHVVRDALNKVINALTAVDGPPVDAAEDAAEGALGSVLDREALRRSNWLKILSAILEGTVLIARNVHVNNSHVLVHCSDGWDRTAQLSSLAQLCLDPHYRTLRGFQILIEKDWLSFGHRFMDRCGHLSSEKFFVTPAEGPGNGGGGAEQAAAAFFASVQNKFVGSGHLKEMSPVFHQFLEVVRNIQRQFPERFEFNERFLRQLHTHLYSCQFGTFLFNNERERRTPETYDAKPPCERTRSVWDFFNSPPELELNRNADYDKTLDDPASRRPKADMGVLFPNTKDVRFWHELYRRTDEEMNGRIVPLSSVEFVAPVEDAAEDPVLQATNPVAAVAGAVQSSRSTPANTFTSSPPADLDSSSTPSPSLFRARTDLSASEPTPGQGSRQQSWADTQDRLGSGVKSVWGRLSFNASAAFSAVQGAYDGVTKDLGGLSVAGSGEDGSSGELRSRQEISGWGAEPNESRLRPATVGGASGSTFNPWQTTTQAPAGVPSVYMDNPWNTTKPAAAPASRAPLTSSTFGERSVADEDTALPDDPTVARPAPLPRGRSALDSSPWDSVLRSGAPDPSAQRASEAAAPTPPRAGSDPLGIGPL